MMNTDDDSYRPEQIRQIREELGLDQEECAELLDISVGTLSRWENGKVIPRKKSREKLETLYNKVKELEKDKKHQLKQALLSWKSFVPAVGSAIGLTELITGGMLDTWIDKLRQSARETLTEELEDDSGSS